MSDDTGDRPQSNNTTHSNSSTSQPPPTQQSGSAAERLLAHFKENKIDSALWATRLLTILFTTCYVLPIFSSKPSAYQKVLLANAATSALRLHQRLPSFNFSREFLARLIAEDSCHYLMYSLIFISVQPTLMILIPIVLFAMLHASSYSLKLLDIIGQNSWCGARFLISLVEFQAANILKAAAFSEIFILPLGVVFTFMGKAGLMTPIVYYHFLVMRYNSRRNPYTRNAFAELRMATETMAARSPPMVAKILRGGIGFVNRLAPQPQPATPTQ